MFLIRSIAVMAESALEGLSDMTTIFLPQFIGNTAYRGITAPVLQSSEWEYDPASGYTFNQVYFGWDYAAMTQYANYFNAYGIGTRIKFENGKATLYTKDSTLATVIDKWEIQVDQTQPDIFQNEIFNFIMNTAADKSSAISLLRTALQNSTAANAAYSWQSLLDGLPAILDTAGNVTTTFMQALGVNFQYLPQLKNYFDDYNLGVTNFISGRYSLRHTTNAPNRWQKTLRTLMSKGFIQFHSFLARCRIAGCGFSRCRVIWPTKSSIITFRTLSTELSGAHKDA